MTKSNKTICTIAQKCEYDEIEHIVTDLFGSAAYAKAWMVTPNRNFGGISPKHLILRDKGDKVRQFIKASIGSK